MHTTVIRQANEQDVSRIAEILVYNNRINFFPIFQDEGYSFGELQVLDVAERYLQDRKSLARVFVYDDGLVRGFAQVWGTELEKLYVDSFFQGRGIGEALLSYAVREKGARFLWALEKNGGALRFYGRHGFLPTGERMLEEGTAEYLLRLEWREEGNAG